MFPAASIDLNDSRSLLLYPTDRAGWFPLTRLLALGKARGGKGCCILDWSDVATHAEGLIGVLIPDMPNDGMAACMISPIGINSSICLEMGTAFANCHR